MMNILYLGHNHCDKAKSTRFIHITLIRLFLIVLLVAQTMLARADLDLTDSVFQMGEEEKSPNAQYTLGVMYLKGKGVPKNENLALTWLKKSAKQDYYLAQYQLGKLYLNGDIVEADPQAAVKYITLVAKKGYSPAQYLLGTLYQSGTQGIAKELNTAISWFERASGQGHMRAKQALEELATVTNPTNAVALYNKGMQYFRGDGVGRDYTLAAQWFTKAAEQGHANAQYSLGELYNKGHGVKKNKKVAQKWYKAATKQGHVKAKYRLRGCAFC